MRAQSTRADTPLMARDSASTISTTELIQAYTIGYFPMARARTDADVVWVLPDERGILMLDKARASRRLKRTLKSHPFEIRINTDFRGVIHGCAEATAARADTWINDAIVEAYCELHYEGLAHSVECWRDGRLVGGLYGIVIGAAFCGESMFSRERDASKIAFLYLVHRLKQGGFDFIDAQFYNEHLAQFGLESMDDEDYQVLLRRALRKQTNFFAVEDQPATVSVLQSITQTS